VNSGRGLVISRFLLMNSLGTLVNFSILLLNYYPSTGEFSFFTVEFEGGTGDFEEGTGDFSFSTNEFAGYTVEFFNFTGEFVPEYW